MGGILRGALLEARALRRSWGGIAAVFTAWILLARLQQPGGRTGFYWGSTEAAWLLVVALLPLLWILS